MAHLWYQILVMAHIYSTKISVRAHTHTTLYISLNHFTNKITKNKKKIILNCEATVRGDFFFHIKPWIFPNKLQFKLSLYSKQFLNY